MKWPEDRVQSALERLRGQGLAPAELPAPAPQKKSGEEAQ